METEPTLKEIQQSLYQVDQQRLDHSLNKDERMVLEIAAIALRKAERLAIARLQDQVIDQMEAVTAQINAMAKTIRTRVTRMGKFPKALDKIETVIKAAVQVLVGVGKWV